MTRLRSPVILACLALAATSAILAACRQESAPTPTAPVTPGPSFPEAVKVELRPVQALLPDRESFGVILYLDPHGHSLSGIEVSVTYDPAVLEADHPARGGVLGEDAADASRVDQSGGRVRVAIARLGAASGLTPAGTLATLRFRFRSAPGSVPTGGNTRLAIGQVLALDAQAQPAPVGTGSPYNWKPIAEAYNRGG